MKIHLFEGTEHGLNLSPKQFEGGISFEGVVWCNQDGDVSYKGKFWDIDEEGGIIPLINYQADGYDLAEALGIDIHTALMDHKSDMASYRDDLD